MRRRLAIAGGLLSALLVVALPAQAQTGTAQEKKATEKQQNKGKDAKEQRIDGTVKLMDAATHTITVQLRGRTSERQVVYDDSTKYTFRNKPSSLDEVKEGRRVIVLGAPNDKNQLVARRIDVREGS